MDPHQSDEATVRCATTRMSSGSHHSDDQLEPASSTGAAFRRLQLQAKQDPPICVVRLSERDLRPYRGHCSPGLASFVHFGIEGLWRAASIPTSREICRRFTTTSRLLDPHSRPLPSKPDFAQQTIHQPQHATLTLHIVYTMHVLPGLSGD